MSLLYLLWDKKKKPLEKKLTSNPKKKNIVALCPWEQTYTQLGDNDMN